MRFVRARALAVFAHHASFFRLSLPRILRGWDDCVRGGVRLLVIGFFDWGGSGINGDSNETAWS